MFIETGMANSFSTMRKKQKPDLVKGLDQFLNVVAVDDDGVEAEALKTSPRKIEALSQL